MLFRFFLCTLLIALFSCSETEKKTKPEKPAEKATLTISDLSQDNIPTSIELKGKFLEAKSWTDKNGENLLIVTRKGPFKQAHKEDEYSEELYSVELFGEQYIKKGSNYILLWDIYDFVRDCMSDMWLGLLPNSTQITDWDEDGITETSLIYKLTCRSDVSPSDMKILIHENEVKMGLRGSMILEMDKAKMGPDFDPDAAKIDMSKLPEMEQYMSLMGRYKNEDDFKEQPKVFLENARKLWMKFMDKDEFQQL
ncbi:MAG: hypothetical protein R8P61_17670 [Bacteroidia bacterium]|nr:hypothetical protein [Bacteroidia bacterium]